MSEAQKLPYPFRKIAVAVAFSPRIEAILAEAKRLQEMFESEMYFIHIGRKDSAAEAKLKDLLSRYKLDYAGNRILWEEGDAVDMIIELCRKNNIDLLVAGALEKESMLKYFVGSVARRLCRKTKCSVLMLHEPSVNAKPIQRIVVEGSDHPKTANTIETGVYFAKHCDAKEVDIIQEEDITTMALIRSNEFSGEEAEEQRERVLREEKDKLEDILNCHDCGDVKINVERVEGKPGFTISKYARDHQADLLLLNSPDTKLGLIDRVFPHDMEYALADLPCDLLIVHSKEEEVNN